MKGTAASRRQGSDGSPMEHRDHADEVGSAHHGGRKHRHLHGGNEFEGVFGLLAGLTMAFGRGRSARLVADEVRVGPGDRVVDVGSGPGRFLREAAQRGAEAVGVEPSEQMRRIAAWRTPASLHERVRVVDGTAERMPLDDGSATVAWAVASFHHWADPEAGLAELQRVLAPGGRLLIAERLSRPGGWLRHHALSREGGERLAAQVGRAGFADVTVAEGDLGRRQLLLVKARRP